MYLRNSKIMVVVVVVVMMIIIIIIQIIQRSHNRNTAHMGCKHKSGNGNNKGDWNHLKITSDST